MTAAATDEIVDDVLASGAHPRKGRARITLAQFADMQQDCAELLSMALASDCDAKSRVLDLLEPRLRTWLADSEEGRIVVSDLAERMAEMERGER